jgi:hypothetical protein
METVGDGLSFEKVWLMFQESGRKFDRQMEESRQKFEREMGESRQKFDREMEESRQKFGREIEESRREMKELREQMQETDRRMQETDRQMQETDRRMRETDIRIQKTEGIVRRNGKQMGDLHRKFGNLAEHLVAPGISRRFNEMGYRFGAIAPGGQRILDANGNIRAEIDLLLENGTFIMAVEVKIDPALKDIPHHIKRLEILREHRDGLGDSRKIQGAIAGAIFDSEVKKAALDAGLFVVEQSGDTIRIDVPHGFSPREW